MTHYKNHIKTFFITSIATIAVYLVIVFYAAHILRIPLKNTEIWLDNLYKVKDYINAQISNKQRLIIISGSNSLFGFDSSLIAKHTKYQPINYATHAGIPINYHIDKIIANAQNGDIVAMPLEFSYYTKDNPKEDIWYISNMLFWGGGYSKYISFKGYILTYFSDSPFAVIKKILQHKRQNISNNPVAEMLMIWDKNIVENNSCSEFSGYDYKSLNAYGDFCAQENKEPFVVDSDYLKLDLQISPFFISEFKRLQDFAQSKNIKIILTYPTTAENVRFSINDSKTHESIANLQAQLAKNGIKIYGNFEDFHFAQTYFYDTSYHLNRQGAILRTQNFIKFLSELENLDKQDSAK